MQATNRTAATTELIQLEREPGVFWYGGWKNLSIAVWKQSATGEAVARIDRTVAARTKLYARLSTVHIALPTAGTPTAEARSAFAEAAARWQAITGCVAVVVEHRGFLASAVRSTVTAIELISRARFPMRAHASIEDAVPWLVEMHERTTGVRLGAGELLEVMQSARSGCT